MEEFGIGALGIAIPCGSRGIGLLGFPPAPGLCRGKNDTQPHLYLDEARFGGEPIPGLRGSPLDSARLDSVSRLDSLVPRTCQTESTKTGPNPDSPERMARRVRSALAGSWLPAAAPDGFPLTFWIPSRRISTGRNSQMNACGLCFGKIPALQSGTQRDCSLCSLGCVSTLRGGGNSVGFRLPHNRGYRFEFDPELFAVVSHRTPTVQRLFIGVLFGLPNKGAPGLDSVSSTSIFPKGHLCSC